MANEYTRENLQEMTVTELRRLCVDVLNIPGLTKKRKDIIVDSILLAQTADESKLEGVSFTGQSVMTKPDEPFGHKTTTTIRVSCGASSGAFPVEGKTVAEVGEFLREVLNVDKLSTGLVNGKEVSGDYELKAGDNLEFMKPAGRKGNGFTKDDLLSKTVTELRRLCVDVLGIPGLTKKRKDIIVDAILLAQTADEKEKLEGVSFTGQSVMTKPDEPFGHKTTTTIRVSCGASSGAFPVLGKTVAEVGEFLREVLNVDKLSTGLVNGKEVAGDYELKEGDNLEFMKPAGRKGH